MKKLTAVLLLLAMMCTLLCACQTGVQNSPDNDIKPSTESADKSETTENDPSEEVGTADPEQDSPPVPVDI